MNHSQYEELLWRLVTLQRDMLTLLEQHRQITDRLTTFLERLGHPPAPGEAAAP